jgi:lysophospholipase L1-like esterase
MGWFKNKVFWWALLGFTVVSVPVAILSPLLAQPHGSSSSPLYNHHVHVIGDSQVVGPFGEQLGILLLNRGASRYTREAHVGWGVDEWSRRLPRLLRALEQSRPSLILVALGGNDTHRIRSREPEFRSEVSALFFGLCQHTRVIWIGPATVYPRGDDTRELVSRAILEEIGEENFVDSQGVTSRIGPREGRQPDGLHFNRTGGLRWATGILPELERKLSMVDNTCGLDEPGC